MKTRNEQPSFKQKADSNLQNRTSSNLQNKADSNAQNKSDSCLSNCNKDSKTKSSMKNDLRLDNCSSKNQ